MKKEIEEIYQYYGKDSQERKAIEELSELIRAVSRKDKGNIIEEIADVEIMIDQLKIMYSIDNFDIEYKKKEKITRTINKINEVKNRVNLI